MVLPPTVMPAARYELASFGELLGDASRAAMLLSLMDGRARPATELAELAGITPSTASLHLKRLLAGNVLAGGGARPAPGHQSRGGGGGGGPEGARPPLPPPPRGGGGGPPPRAT